MKTTQDYVNELTQNERDRVLQWFIEHRPSPLREALRGCGYIKTADYPVPGPGNK